MGLSVGRQFEKDVLGVEVEWKWKELSVDFYPAILQAVYKQPNNWNPLRPTTRLGNALLGEINTNLYHELEGYCSEDKRQYIVRNNGLYVALGTPADYLHETDAVVFCDLGRKTAMVTIDLTTYESKKEDVDLRPNHVIITPSHFRDITPSGKTRLDVIAGVIAEQLVEQLIHKRVLKIPIPQSYMAS